MSGHAHDCAADGLMLHWIFQHVCEDVVDQVLVFGPEGEFPELLRRVLVTSSQGSDRLPVRRASADRLLLHQICPALNIPDDVVERRADSFVPMSNC